MSGNKSKIELAIKLFQKLFHVWGAIAGPVCAGLDWLASKLHKKGRARQTVGKDRKEKSVMLVTILKFAAFAGGGLLVVFALFQGLKKWFADRTEPTAKISEISPPGVEKQPVPTVSYQALFAKKRELEQRMASVTGGETGLFMLREMMRDADREGMPDIQYREAYRMKQDKLSGYMKDYRALLKQAEDAPKEEKGRLQPVEGIERYQELLDEKI